MRDYGMHEDMIYGLMRQESMFREVAESRSGALGLMQIMPKTGAWLAGRMGIKEYDLTDPETSIKLGKVLLGSDALQRPRLSLGVDLV